MANPINALVRVEGTPLAALPPVDPLDLVRMIACARIMMPEAMVRLAASFPPEHLAEEAFRLYERFRPKIPSGEKGWGAKGVLDLALMERLTNWAA